jgi:ketosteroid isomerase-like protein
LPKYNIFWLNTQKQLSYIFRYLRKGFCILNKTIYNVMKKLLLLMSLGLFLSCSNVQHSDYERNLEITKEWFDTFGNEDLEATMSYFADEIEYQSAFYGGPLMNKAETTEYYKGWHDAMEGITYEAQNYLPGVDPDTGLLNGSVRTYGHWSGTKSDSGKTFKGLWYHYLTFDENGKIINGGDFGDATGLIMSVMPDQE